MPHGSVTLGGIEVVALCDSLRTGPWSLEEAFPDVGVSEWAEFDSAHPETVGVERGWRAHDHCYLVRGAERTILVDTGIGPAGTPVADLLHPAGGSLPSELEAAGARPEDVDVVVLTHMHFDHIGWNVSGPAGDPRPTFPRATYLLQRDEWDAYATGDDDPHGGPARERSVRWLREAGALELVAGEHEIADGIRLAPTRGHTPGSQSVVISSGGGGLIVAGDVANHPLQVSRPDRRSFADSDPAAAAATRRATFERASREDSLIATAHFPQPFGHVVDSRWSPIA
jgi:glyoxylase-like metal-dependent hydrolase (beta-lactamase superfamily II)